MGPSSSWRRAIRMEVRLHPFARAALGICVDRRQGGRQVQCRPRQRSAILVSELRMTTKQTDNPKKRHSWAAAVAALALLLGSGLGYRAVASRHADWIAIPPLPAGSLAPLRLQVGDWSGEDSPLDAGTIEVLDADDHLNRLYKSRGGEAVELFVALRRRDVAYGVPARDLVPHRPQVCYLAHGWTPDDTYTATMEAADGSSLPVRISRFHRGDLETERVTVLSYYIIVGRRGHSPSELRASGWRPKGVLRYVAQVEVASGDGATRRSAEGSVRAFAAESAPGILTVITNALEQVGPQANQTPG